MSGGAWGVALAAIAGVVSIVGLWIRKALIDAEARGYRQASGEAAIEIQKREDAFARETKRRDAERQKRAVRHAEDLERLEEAPTKRDVDQVADGAGVTAEDIESFVEGRRSR